MLRLKRDGLHWITTWLYLYRSTSSAGYLFLAPTLTHTVDYLGSYLGFQILRSLARVQQYVQRETRRAIAGRARVARS